MQFPLTISVKKGVSGCVWGGGAELDDGDSRGGVPLEGAGPPGGGRRELAGGGRGLGAAAR